MKGGADDAESRERVETFYRSESRRVFATLIRVLGDFDLAEEALQDAFTSAVEQWPREGVPKNPRAWLVSAGRFKAIDAMRRRARFDASLAELVARLHADSGNTDAPDPEGIEDDRLRMDENAMNASEREQCYKDSTRLSQDLHAGGQLRGVNPLQSVTTATSVRVRESKRLVTDGPFAETREQLGEYFLIEADDLDAAISIAARIPGARKGTVEIRPVLEISGLPKD